MWDATSGTPLVTGLQGFHTAKVSCMTWSPGGVLASGGVCSSVNVWDLEAKKPKHALKLLHSNGGVNALCFSDESTLVTCGLVFLGLGGFYLLGNLYYLLLNRRYYKQKRMAVEDPKRFKSLRRRAKFKALPSVFVFPSLFMLAANFFLTKFTNASIMILSYDGAEPCGAECLVPAIVRA